MDAINTPRKVELYVLFRRIGTIDVLKETFEADIQIESQWTETESFTDYDAKTLWNPHLYVHNATSIAKEDTKYKISADNSGRKIITELKTIKGKCEKGFESLRTKLRAQKLRKNKKTAKVNPDFSLTQKYRS